MQWAVGSGGTSRERDQDKTMVATEIDGKCGDDERRRLWMEVSGGRQHWEEGGGCVWQWWVRIGDGNERNREEGEGEDVVVGVEWKWCLAMKRAVERETTAI